MFSEESIVLLRSDEKTNVYNQMIQNFVLCFTRFECYIEIRNFNQRVPLSSKQKQRGVGGESVFCLDNVRTYESSNEQTPVTKMTSYKETYIDKGEGKEHREMTMNIDIQFEWKSETAPCRQDRAIFNWSGPEIARSLAAGWILETARTCSDDAVRLIWTVEEDSGQTR